MWSPKGPRLTLVDSFSKTGLEALAYKIFGPHAGELDLFAELAGIHKTLSIVDLHRAGVMSGDELDRNGIPGTVGELFKLHVGVRDHVAILDEVMCDRNLRVVPLDGERDIGFIFDSDGELGVLLKLLKHPVGAEDVFDG